jgi:hypothetical protein
MSMLSSAMAGAAGRPAGRFSPVTPPGGGQLGAVSVDFLLPVGALGRQQGDSLLHLPIVLGEQAEALRQGGLAAARQLGVPAHLPWYMSIRSVPIAQQPNPISLTSMPLRARALPIPAPFPVPVPVSASGLERAPGQVG